MSTTNFCHFFTNEREQEGTEFEPGTLSSFQHSFGRHLSELGKHYCLFKDKEFAESREMLESKWKQLGWEGKGCCPKEALGLKEDELEKLWSANQLGDHSPEALICTVGLYNTIHFSWRARDEHRKVLMGDLELQREEGAEKCENIIWHTERGSKTRSGVKEFTVERYFNSWIYKTGNEKHPVKFVLHLNQTTTAGNYEDLFLHSFSLEVYSQTERNKLQLLWGSVP